MITNKSVKYVVTDDSPDVVAPSNKKSFNKAIVFFSVLIAITVPSLYTLGFILGDESVETVADDGSTVVQIKGAKNALCLSYRYVVDSCGDVSVAKIQELGCMYFVEAAGGICECFDDSRTSCVVNSDCDIVEDTSGLPSGTVESIADVSTVVELGGAEDALCLSYEYVVDSCDDVTEAQIQEIGCMYFVEGTGGICVCFDDSKTSCVVNSDCDTVEDKLAEEGYTVLEHVEERL